MVVVESERHTTANKTTRSPESAIVGDAGNAGRIATPASEWRSWRSEAYQLAHFHPVGWTVLLSTSIPTPVLECPGLAGKPQPRINFGGGVVVAVVVRLSNSLGNSAPSELMTAIRDPCTKFSRVRGESPMHARRRGSANDFSLLVAGHQSIFATPRVESPTT